MIFILSILQCTKYYFAQGRVGISACTEIIVIRLYHRLSREGIENYHVI